MSVIIQPHLLVAGVAGLGAGVALFTRGLAAYRRGAVVSSIASSEVASLAAGEIRLTGTVHALGRTLVSPLQSAACVWYHSIISESGENEITILDEERACEFELQDETGAVRVIPHGARWEVTPVFDETTGLFGGVPDGLRGRVGPESVAVPEDERQAAIAALLTVRPQGNPEGVAARSAPGIFRQPTGRHYRESRIEPGQLVTIVGQAIPFGELGAETGSSSGGASVDDPVLAAELAEARAAGILAMSAEEAWGNAAIPGFGIGRPEERPELDPAATVLPAADAAQAARAEHLFEIAPETLVVARRPGAELVVYTGVPAEARRRQMGAFYRGLAGAGLASISAVVLAVVLNGGL